MTMCFQFHEVWRRGHHPKNKRSSPAHVIYLNQTKEYPNKRTNHTTNAGAYEKYQPKHDDAHSVNKLGHDR